MTISFNKKIATYLFGGFIISSFVILVFVYIQLKDLDNFKNLVVEKIEEITGRKVFIEKVELGFEKGISINLEQLSVYSRDGKSQDFSAKNVWCVIKLWPLLSKEIEVKEFILEGATIEVVRDEQGKFNFGNSLSLLTGETSSRLLKLLGIGLMHQISVLNSKVKFRDYYVVSDSKPFSTLIDSIELTINQQIFQNKLALNLSGKIPNKYQTTVFKLSGYIDSFENLKRNEPIPIRGKIKLDQLYLGQLRPYLKNILSNVSNGTKLSFESDISGALGGSLSVNGGLKYSSAEEASLSTLGSQGQGEIEYTLQLDKDSIEIESLKARSGQSSISGKGKFVGYQTKDPRLAFTIQSDEFKIENSRRNFPLMFFPEN
ncbi:MAG TPA: AsmA family protein, partial [Nitrospinaceae bacterium]|nr:AsmA family protein [Nitrospinaceae bacterium]